MIPLGVLASAYVAPAAGGGALVPTYLANYTTSSRINYWTDSASVGPPAGDRYVILGIGGYVDSPGFSNIAVTIGGVAATIDGASSSAGGPFATFASALVPANSAAVFAITYTGTAPTRQGFGLWTVTGSASITAATPTSATSTSASITAGDATFAVQYGGTYTSSLAWTGATARFNTAIAGRFLAGADSTASGSATISTNYAGAFPAFAVASYSAT